VQHIVRQRKAIALQAAALDGKEIRRKRRALQVGNLPNAAISAGRSEARIGSKSDSPRYLAYRGNRQAFMNIKRLFPYVAPFLSAIAVTLLLLPLRDFIGDKPGVVGFVELIIVVLIASKWGTWFALLASIANVLSWQYFFIKPYDSFSIFNLEDGMLFVTFLITSIIVGQLSAQAKRRAEDAEMQKNEIARLYADLQRENSERKSAETALRKSQEELEMRVQQRTSELKDSNQQLASEVIERMRAEAVLKERSQELARSNAELERFAYVASHDLQEPLRMVSSYLQLIASRYQDKLDADANQFIEFAVEGAKRMRMLIRDLLDYSQVDTRAKPFAPVDCEAVFKTVLKNLQVKIQENAAQISCAPLPGVIGDATQLAQLFQNLIDNAIKFQCAQAPVIHIGVEEKNGYWQFSVEDNGIGIDPEYFDRLFILFQRLHGRAAYPGTGMGLAICKKIVERHGGAIWIKSQAGSGSTFFFTLPQKGVRILWTDQQPLSRSKS